MARCNVYFTMDLKALFGGGQPRLLGGNHTLSPTVPPTHILTCRRGLRRRCTPRGLHRRQKRDRTPARQMVEKLCPAPITPDQTSGLSPFSTVPPARILTYCRVCDVGAVPVIPCRN